MSDPIRDLADRLARVERELHALATAPRANNTAVRDGFTRWLPAEGEAPGVYIGGGVGGDVGIAGYDNDGVQWFGAGAETGQGRFFIRNADDTSSVVDVINGKMLRPLISCAWQIGTNVNIDTQGRPTNNTATYVDLWRTALPVTAGRVYGAVIVFPGVAGTFADARITASSLNTGNPFVTVAETLGVTGGFGALIGPWDVPETVLVPSGNPTGHLIEFRIELRRTAGAGTVAIAPQLPLINWF